MTVTTQTQLDARPVTDEDLGAFLQRVRGLGMGDDTRTAIVIAAAGVLELRRRNDLAAVNARHLQALTAAVERFVSEH